MTAANCHYERTAREVLRVADAAAYYDDAARARGEDDSPGARTRRARRETWMPRQVTISGIYDPHNVTIAEWIDASGATWLDVGICGLLREHLLLVVRADRAFTEAFPEDECVLCGEMWPSHPDTSRAHVRAHVYGWVLLSGYVVPAFYEDADVLGDALSVAFATLASFCT